MTSRSLRYLRTNFDDLAIVTSLGHMAATAPEALADGDFAVMAALQRAVPDLANSSQEDVSEYLLAMDADQLQGLTSNVKGVLHEMQFVEIENSNGDSVHAALFESSNHPGYDVTMVDAETGETWALQLKATDNSGYVQDWIDAHPDGEILVTEELAQEMDIESSGIGNEELTADVSTFVDKMQSAADDSVIWDYFPALTLASVAIVVGELWLRLQRGQISAGEFQRLAAHATGMKVGKIALLMAGLSIPVVGQVVGAVLVAQLLINAKSSFFDGRDKHRNSSYVYTA